MKIDRGFVEGLRHGHRDLRIAEMIVRIGESLQLTTVAEGVEDEAQQELLRELRCANAQASTTVAPSPIDMGVMLRSGLPHSVATSTVPTPARGLITDD